jgi:hypothetical protein
MPGGAPLSPAVSERGKTQMIDAECHLWGKGFAPSRVLSLPDIVVRECTAPGETAATGRNARCIFAVLADIVHIGHLDLQDGAPANFGHLHPEVPAEGLWFGIG